MERDARPWGGYEVLFEGPECKVKRIEVRPGTRLSYQLHRKRSEHWMFVQGTGTVTIDGAQIQVEPGRAVDIPLGAAHRVANTGTEPLVFIEIQTGEYFGEDDIVRLEDDYGRADS